MMFMVRVHVANGLLRIQIKHVRVVNLRTTIATSRPNNLRQSSAKKRMLMNGVKLTLHRPESVLHGIECGSAYAATSTDSTYHKSINGQSVQG